MQIVQFPNLFQKHNQISNSWKISFLPRIFNLKISIEVSASNISHLTPLGANRAIWFASDAQSKYMVSYRDYKGIYTF